MPPLQPWGTDSLWRLPARGQPELSPPENAYVYFDSALMQLMQSTNGGAYVPFGGGGGAGGGPLLRSFGPTLLIQENQAAPVTEEDVRKLSFRTNEDVWSSLDEAYSRCAFVMRAGPAVATGLSFQTRDAVVTWLNANAPQAGGVFTESVSMMAYDTLDHAITPPAKVWGKNGVMSRIRSGDSSGYKSPRSPCVVENNWSPRGGDELLIQAWQTVYGEALPTPLTDSVRGAFWTPKIGCNMYQIRSRLGIDASAGRFAQDTSDGSFQPQVDPALWDSSVSPWFFGIINNEDGSVVGIATRRDFTNNAYAIFRQNRSVVFIAPLSFTDPARRAVTIRPLGVDQIYTSYYDPAAYRLEALSCPTSDGQVRIRPLSSPLLGSSGRDVSGPFMRGEWLPATSAPAKGFKSRYGPGDVAFYLRDLATNRVSPLSAARVTWWLDRNLASPASIVTGGARY